MSAPLQVDPEKVVVRLSQQVGGLAAELAIREVALEAADARIAELERTLHERDTDIARLQQANELLTAHAGQPDTSQEPPAA